MRNDLTHDGNDSRDPTDDTETYGNNFDASTGKLKGTGRSRWCRLSEDRRTVHDIVVIRSAFRRFARGMKKLT